MSLLQAFRAIPGRLLDLALPAACAGCGREGPPLCANCAPATETRVSLPAGTVLGLPAQIPAPLLQLEWCSPFTGVTRRALHQLKYGGERRLAAPLGAAIARRWARAGAGGDLLVPVPVHADRARARGYDQAVLLAQEAGARLGLPSIGLLQRARPTVPQYRLDRSRRAHNVSGAFSIAVDGRVPALRGRWVVLVDDVVTTGATLAACADVLLAAGALAVSAVTVARER
jgi:ComF family protein